MKYLLVLLTAVLLGTTTISEYQVPNSIVITEPIVISQSNQIIDFKNSSYTLNNGANCPMIIIGSLEEEPTILTENIVIENLILDGNKDSQDYEIWFNHPNYIRNNGISIRFCKNVTIRNCVITNSRSGNIVIEKNCENIIIENCVLSNAFFDGLACYISKGCIIRNNTITGNNYAGISLDLQFNDNIIINNIIINNDLGIFLRHCDNNSFSHNVMKNRSFDFYFNQVDNDATTLPRNNSTENNKTVKDFINQL